MGWMGRAEVSVGARVVVKRPEAGTATRIPAPMVLLKMAAASKSVWFSLPMKRIDAPVRL